MARTYKIIIIAEEIDDERPSYQAETKRTSRRTSKVEIEAASRDEALGKLQIIIPAL